RAPWRVRPAPGGPRAARPSSARSRPARPGAAPARRQRETKPRPRESPSALSRLVGGAVTFGRRIDDRTGARLGAGARREAVLLPGERPRLHFFHVAPPGVRDRVAQLRIPLHELGSDVPVHPQEVVANQDLTVA